MPTADATASVVRDGNALRVSGALLRDAVPAVWRQGMPLLAGVERFDLARVDRVDSAGVALLAALAARTGGVSIDGAPHGLADLRGAYRLGPGLAFAQ